MWLCLNRSFLSIVNNSDTKGDLLVRARRKGDIEKVFPDARVFAKPGRDYLYRASIKKQDVASALFNEVMNIEYPNFKDSVDDKPLHDAYARFWGIMGGLQEIPPYHTFPRKNYRGELESIISGN